MRGGRFPAREWPFDVLLPALLTTTTSLWVGVESKVRLQRVVTPLFQSLLVLHHTYAASSLQNVKAGQGHYRTTRQDFARARKKTGKQGLCGLQAERPSMGVVEYRRVPLHPLLRYPSWDGHAHQPRQVDRPRYVDTRTDAVHSEVGKSTCKSVLGSPLESGTYPSRSQNGIVHPFQVRDETVGTGRPSSL